LPVSCGQHVPDAGRSALDPPASSLDFPNFVEGREVERVPIIITGNDFTKLYGATDSAGAHAVIFMVPTVDEKCEVLEGIFPELSGRECLELIQAFPEQPVAFFSDLRTQLIEDTLWEHIIELALRKLLHVLHKVRGRGYSTL